VNRSQLLNELAERNEWTRRQADEFLTSFTDLITATVSTGEDVAISGFAKFRRIDRPARMARNPATGAAVSVKKTAVPAFKAGTQFKEITSGARKLAKAKGFRVSTNTTFFGQDDASTVRVLHANPPGLDTLDAPRRRAQQKHVARQTLHREVFIDGADDSALRLRHHLILSTVRNRAAIRDRHQTRAAPSAQPVIHLISMQECTATPARGRHALGEHLDHRIKVAPSEVAIGIRPVHECEQGVFIPIVTGRQGHNLLRQNIQWRARNL